MSSSADLIFDFLGLWLCRHGYGRWQTIVDDKELSIQEIICKELNLSVINLPVPGASQPQVAPARGPSQDLPASGVPQAEFTVPGAFQPSHGVNTANAGSVGGQVKATGDGNTCGAELSHGTSDPSNRQVIQDSSSLYHHYREMQRKQVEFIKKRVLLLEKGLNAEYQKEAFVSCLIKLLKYMMLDCLLSVIYMSKGLLLTPNVSVLQCMSSQYQKTNQRNFTSKYFLLSEIQVFHELTWFSS